MKKILFITLLVFSLFACAKKPTLIILTEDYPPLSYMENGEAKGFGSEVVKEIMKRLHTTYDITLLPWEAAYERALNEPNILLYTMELTEQRKPLFKWVGPIGNNVTSFYSRKTNQISLGDIEDAKIFPKIATCSSWFNEQYLKNKGFTNLLSSPTPEETFKNLMEGKADLAVFTDVTVGEIAAKAGYNKDDIDPVYTVLTSEFYLAFSQQTPNSIVDSWNSAFDAMKKDGTFKALYEKYLPGKELSD